MKKKLSFALCLLMIFTGIAAALPVTSATTVFSQAKAVTTVNKAQKVVSGKVKDATMNTILISDKNGKTYAFSTMGAKIDAKKGINIGVHATIVYTGTLNKNAKAIKVTISY